MAERLGWHNKRLTFRLPRVVGIEQFFEQNLHGHAEFAAGIDILEVMHQLYDEEYKYERRHKRPFATFDDIDGNAFFDVVGGRYPNDELLTNISDEYAQVFSPEKLPHSADTATKLYKEGFIAPLWITRHGLEESDAGDVIDYWNYRLIARRVVPINLEWLVHHKDFIRERILQVHRPVPGNPFGTKFHIVMHFGSSISDETVVELVRKHLDGLPDMSFFWGRDPLIWQRIGRGHERRETKILATSKPVSFDEEISPEGYVRLPAPSPTFLNATSRFTEERWVNLIVPEHSHREDDPAIVYRSNLWPPDYPWLAASESLRIGREGWALQQQHAIGVFVIATAKWSGGDHKLAEDTRYRSTAIGGRAGRRTGHRRCRGFASLRNVC
jgi:hypothetical protein